MWIDSDVAPPSLDPLLPDLARLPWLERLEWTGLPARLPAPLPPPWTAPGAFPRLRRCVEGC